jgi:hypothetical protein
LNRGGRRGEREPGAGSPDEEEEEEEAEGRTRERTWGGGRQEAGGRRQEAGGRRQEAGGRRQEAGGRRQEAGGRREGTYFFTNSNMGKNLLDREICAVLFRNKFCSRHILPK